MSKIDHKQRARAAWPNLAQIAVDGGKTPYSEVARSLGLHHRSARWFLGVIQTECEARGLPPLQAIVVNKQTGFPGKGYIASSRKGKQYKAALALVHAYDWPKTAPF